MSINNKIRLTNKIRLIFTYKIKYTYYYIIIFLWKLIIILTVKITYFSNPVIFKIFLKIHKIS